MSSYITEGSVSMSFQLNANYTMFIQTHYTNCSVKTLNVIEEPSEKAASKNSPPPFNLITLAFTGPISALKLLTKLLLIPSVQASIAVVEVGATACHWSGEIWFLCAFRLGYLKAPTEMIVIMNWVLLLPSSDEVMCRDNDMVPYKRGPRWWWPFLVKERFLLPCHIRSPCPWERREKRR